MVRGLAAGAAMLVALVAGARERALCPRLERSPRGYRNPGAHGAVTALVRRLHPGAARDDVFEPRTRSG